MSASGRPGVTASTSGIRPSLGFSVASVTAANAEDAPVNEDNARHGDGCSVTALKASANRASRLLSCCTQISYHICRSPNSKNLHFLAFWKQPEQRSRVLLVLAVALDAGL